MSIFVSIFKSTNEKKTTDCFPDIRGLLEVKVNIFQLLKVYTVLVKNK